MTERELFDAIGRLPEQYRTEAFAAEQVEKQPNEIDALFESAARTEAVQYRNAPAPEAAAQSQNGTIRQSVQQKPQKSGIFGLSVIAAAVALTVGLFAWKMHSDMQSNPAASGSSARADFVQQSDVSSENLTSPADGDSQQAADPESSSIQSADSGIPDDGQDQTENVLGGHGRLKTVMNYSGILILEDQENWYVNGARRISKTMQNENGHLYGELLCMTPGCAHTDSRCPYYNFNNRLLSDGTDLYWTDDESQIYKKLMRLGENGEWEDFFSVSRSAVYDALAADYKREYPERKNNIGIAENTYYYCVLKLGDYGYYIGCIMQFANAPQFLFGVLLDQSMEAFTLLPLGAEIPVFDDVHGLLYLPRPFTADAGTLQQINVYDLNQITLSFEPQDKRAEPVRVISLGGNPQCCTADGKLYYMNNYTGDTRDLMCFDPELGDGGESVVIEHETDKTNLMSADGRLYYKLHVRVGKDKLCACLPDLTQEEVIYETPNALGSVYPITDPSFIRIETNMGTIFLVNGEAVRVETVDYG